MKQAVKSLSISGTTHPDYDAEIRYWRKYRLTFIGGRKFINKYLEKLSKREDTTDFENRKKITYCPAHAKAAVIDIKNAIYQRMVDILRDGGPSNWQVAITGEDNGVDFQGNSMNGFIGRIILPELLSMRKVGVFVDKDPIEGEANANDTREKRPYLYVYKAEEIRSWRYNRKGQLQSLLLRDTNEKVDEETGLVTETEERYRLLQVTDDGVIVKFYDKNGKYIEDEDQLLQLKRIPFVIFEISQSLLIDVADYQIALLNLGSSDINYAIRANFPFYTEQFDPATEFAMLRQATSSETVTDSGTVTSNKSGEAAEAKKANDNEIQLGTIKGRRYPKSLERPGYIHPSPDPLRASMEKQKELRDEIRQLVNLAVTNLQPIRASAESKREDDKSLEAGLSYIGLELEYGERQIAAIWSDYESAEQPKISYPTSYSLRTDEDRHEEAEKLEKRREGIPSKTYQIEITKLIVKTILGPRTDNATMQRIFDEIDKSPALVTDHETLREDHEKGLVGTLTASILAGYPEGEVDKAKKDHAERAARIALAQSKAGARGVSDLGNPDDGTKEKELSNQPDTDPDGKDKTRGGGK